jgi:hypothetical protein
MTITISPTVLLAAGVLIGWFGFGVAFNMIVLRRVKNAYLNRHRTGRVPDFFHRIAYCAAGPVGLAVWGVDLISQARIAKRNRLARAGHAEPDAW